MLDRITLTAACGRVSRCSLPVEGATHVTCEHFCECGDARLQGGPATIGPAHAITERSDHYVAEAICFGCGARAGTLRVYVRTLFGLEEDAAVLGDGRRCRVY